MFSPSIYLTCFHVCVAFKFLEKTSTNTFWPNSKTSFLVNYITPFSLSFLLACLVTWTHLPDTLFPLPSPPSPGIIFLACFGHMACQALPPTSNSCHLSLPSRFPGPQELSHATILPKPPSFFCEHLSNTCRCSTGPPFAPPH